MSDLIVQLTNTGKAYNTVDVLNDINLNLNPSEVLGLFGHNGAGKTTMMKLILGIIKPTSGEVNVFDHNPISKYAWQNRKQIGYLPENVSFYDHLTGLEVLTYFARLKSAPKTQVLELLEQVGLSHAQKRQVKTYSKGMRQRLGLAQAFLGTPKLLLLDEPTVGLDPIATKEFYTSVDNLKTSGASIILCSHVLPGVEQHIDRAMILSGGNMKALGTLEQLRAQAALPITIHAHGLNGSVYNDPSLNIYLVNRCENQNKLEVAENQKLTVLRQLLSYDHITNIHVESPSLERLYQHYLSDNHMTSKKGAQL